MNSVLFMLCVFSFPFVCGTLEGDEPLAVMPKLSADWQLQEDEKRGEAQKRVPYRWCVYKNRNSGELLSIAVRKLAPDQQLSLEKYADTAFEIFPSGNAVWTSGSKKIESLYHKLDTTRTGDQMLDYGFVCCPKDSDNMLAHGVAWKSDEQIVFVQQTSHRPITSRFVRTAALQYIDLLKEFEKASN
ncbi:MAG: hypothetical protein AAF483_31120 [Planctomycetota bacterium]